MQHAVMTPKTLSRDAQRLLSAIEESQARPDLLDEETARMLRSLARAINNGNRLTAKQAWAIEAVQRRVARGEKRDGTVPPAPVMRSPAPAAPAAAMPTSTPKVTTTVPTALAPDKNAPVLMPVSAIVRHSMHGRGHVVIAEQGKSVVSFDYGQHVRVPNDRLKLVPADEDEGKLD